MNYIQVVIRALAASMSARAAAMAMRFVTICLLPFWLTPAEIGWSAVLMALINLVIAFIDLGFGTSLIKARNCTERMCRSVFTLILGVSFAGALGLILGAGPIGAFLSLPAHVIMISAFAVPFSVLAIVPNALLQRDLRFTSLAMRDLLGEITFSGTAIGLAVAGHPVTCIAWALAAQRVVRWIVSSVSVSWRPAIAFCTEDIKSLLSFSMFQLGNITVTQLANRLDTFLMSILMTPAMLGFYAQAQQLSTTPFQSLMGAVTNVFFASFAKIQTETDKIRTLFVKITRGIIALSLIAVGIMYPLMGVIPLIYGEDWAASVEIARTLCFSIPFFAAAALEGVLLTIGGERRRLLASVVRAVTMAAGIAALFLLLPGNAGPVGVAWIVFAASGIGFALNFRFICRKLEISGTYVRAWIKPAVLGFAAAAAGIAATHIFL